MQFNFIWRNAAGLGIGLLAIIVTLILVGCGGGSSSAYTASSTGVPVIWDQADALWDSANWQ